MTRLTEAFERARKETDGPADTAVATPARERKSPTDDVPGNWNFTASDVVVRVPSPQTPPPVVRSAGIEPPRGREVEARAGLDTQAPVDPRHAFGDGSLVSDASDSTFVEQYRRLAAALHHAQLQSGIRTVMVSSAVEAEGKTLTATNLALTLSHSYRWRVLLVDADFRRPAIHERLALDNRVGLGDVLRRPSKDGKLPVQRVSSTLWVMTAGRPIADPMSGLVSDTMRQFLAEASEQFDWIVIDTPPVALLPDANVLSEMIDTALLVVSANTTPYELVVRAVEGIGAARILGIVLNRAESSQIAVRYGYHGYSYGESSQPSQRRWFGLFGKG